MAKLQPESWVLKELETRTKSEVFWKQNVRRPEAEAERDKESWGAASLNDVVGKLPKG